MWLVRQTFALALSAVGSIDLLYKLSIAVRLSTTFAVQLRSAHVVVDALNGAM